MKKSRNSVWKVPAQRARFRQCPALCRPPTPGRAPAPPSALARAPTRASSAVCDGGDDARVRSICRAPSHRARPLWRRQGLCAARRAAPHPEASKPARPRLGRSCGVPATTAQERAAPARVRRRRGGAEARRRARGQVNDPVIALNQERPPPRCPRALPPPVPCGRRSARSRKGPWRPSRHTATCSKVA